MRLDQPERLVDIEALRRQQDGRHAARGLHELMHAGAMRQRRHHQRGVIFRGAGHQVGQVIGHHKGHLAVGQHRGLGASRGARGEEEPAGIVVVDRGLRRSLCRACAAIASLTDLSPKLALADPPDEAERRARRLHGRGMVRKIAVAQKRLGAGRGGEPGDFVRHQPEIGRHPDRAEPEGREHRPEHLVAILGMHEDAVALADAARGQRRRQRRDLTVDLRARSRIVRPR